MYRTDAPNSKITAPTPTPLGSEHYFRNGALGVGDGTELAADFLNATQESLIAILADQSIPHSKVDATKILAALTQLVETKIAQMGIATRGKISGLTFDYSQTTISTGSLGIRPGVCRNNANDGWIENSALSFKLLGPATGWAPGPTANGLASGNSNFTGTAGTKVWALGKSDGSNAFDFGFDSHDTGANLLSDAASLMWDRIRQIGHVQKVAGYQGGDVIVFHHNEIDPDLWLQKDPEQTVDVQQPAIPATYSNDELINNMAAEHQNPGIGEGIVKFINEGDGPLDLDWLFGFDTAATNAPGPSGLSTDPVNFSQHSVFVRGNTGGVSFSSIPVWKPYYLSFALSAETATRGKTFCLTGNWDLGRVAPRITYTPTGYRWDRRSSG